MTPIILEKQFDKVKKIYHIGDIHLRLLKRHNEYKVIFERLFKEIEEGGTENSLICILGDLVHSKTELSPELMREVSNFLKNCERLCPTILIAGNHDANLNNKSRLDSLSPIVEALNLKNLFYLKDTGLYEYGDCLFVNYSIFDCYTPEKYIIGKEIPKSIRRKYKRLIGLFHGPLNNAMTDVGYRVNDRSLPLEVFDTLDLVLCADIHKRQILQKYNEYDKKPWIVYVGSTVQQNFGEDLNNHGYCVWNLDENNFKFYDIENECGFFTIEIKNNKLLTSLDNLPKKAKLRVKCDNTVVHDVKNIVSKIKEKYNLDEITYLPVSTYKSETKNLNYLELENVYDVEYQNKLIKNFIESADTENITKEVCDLIFNINLENNNSITKSDSAKNLKWKAKKFEFSNMFSYGEDNTIDFTNMQNVYGLFAKNASGKTSCWSALCFCLFDKCAITFKASEILNIQKVSFKCKFNFELDGTDYFIERHGVKDKKGNVKVDVQFYKLINGEICELNGEGRRSTNDVIRDYIGSYDDFILTTLSLQGGKSLSFIDMGQSERKDLLIKFMGIDIFDKLHVYGQEKYKEICIQLRSEPREELESKLKDNKQLFVSYNKEIKELESKKTKLEETNERLESEIEEFSKKLIPINFKPSKKLEELITDIDSYKTNVESIKNIIHSIENELVIQNKNLLDLIHKKETIDNSDSSLNYKKYQDSEKLLRELNNSLEKEKIKITGKINKLKHLETHQYDPNCSFCINNVFVKDALDTKKELSLDKENIAKLLSEISNLKECLSELDSYKNYDAEYRELNSEINKQSNDISKKENLILKRNNDLEFEIRKIDRTQHEITEYHNNQSYIEQNSVIEKEIVALKNEKDISKNNYKIVSEKYNFTSSEITRLKNEINSLIAKIDTIKLLEKKRDAYEIYLSCISRDGIPNMLINQSAPKIQNEVNNILSQIVEFLLEIVIENKNVYTNIVYDDKKWSLDLASGMEKFIASLTLRCAISNISHLPKSNFLVIDEGFGQLDSENIQSIMSFFNFLKNQYDFIIIISHLDVMRDLVDNHLDIKNENGFSKINH